MNRRSFVRNTGLTLGTLALLNSRSFGQLFSDPAFKVKMLTDKIGIFTEKGGTILFMISDDGIVVVDSQFPDSAQHMIEEIKKKAEQPFRLLINTHHHADHTSGNIAFKDLVPHVLAHSNSLINQKKAAESQKTEEKQLYPDQTYTNIWCEKIGKEQVCLHYFGAGHTNGDSVVEFRKAKIVHMGDLVFNRRHPFVDRNAGANISNWIKVLETTASKFSKKTTYVCGHAAEGFEVTVKRSDILLFRDYLANVLLFTEQEIKSGKTKEEILKATMIPGSPEWTGKGIERPLTAAFEELTEKR